MRRAAAILLACLAAAPLLEGCTTVRATSPSVTAQQQLLITTAADRAAKALAAQMPRGLSVTLDTSGLIGPDKDYAIAAVKDAFLRAGLRLAPDSKDAEATVLLRAGALSTREHKTLIGLPPVPIPLLPGAVLPEVDLFKRKVEKGVAKFAATAYDPKTGQLIVSTEPAWGFSRADDGVVLFLITWSNNDLGVDLSANPPKVK